MHNYCIHVLPKKSVNTSVIIIYRIINIYVNSKIYIKDIYIKELLWEFVVYYLLFVKISIYTLY